MKLTRTLALIAATGLLVAACSKEPDEVAANTNPLLAYVPQDTVYVAAALEPIPKDITDAYVARFQPVLDVMAEQVENFQTEYASGNHEGNKMAALAMAILDELDNNISADSLAKFGITLQSHHAIYAMGVFPVMRLSLDDTKELRNAIARIEIKMGFEIPEKDFNGKPYWQLSEDEVPVGLYIAILDQQLAISIFPVNAENDLLAPFMGETMPAQSMADSNALAIMNSTKGYTGYGSGILDLKKMADELLNPDSATHSYLGPNVHFDVSTLDPVCVDEARAIIEKTPRMTAGVTKLTSNEVATSYELEIESALGSALAALVSDTPAAEDSDHLLSGSLAIKIGKLRSFLLEKATGIAASPYQCAELQDLNRVATDLTTQLNIPMPPMINNLMGMRVRLDDFDPSSSPPTGSGLLALHVDKPEMFIGMASMMVPGFDTLDLANQSEPVKIPAEMLHMATDLDVSALMSDNAIGAAIGGQTVNELGPFMAVKSQNNGTFFSVSYDMAKQLEIQQAFSENWNYTPDDQDAAALELTEALKESYTAMLGRSRAELSFSGDGLVIESLMTFK